MNHRLCVAAGSGLLALSLTACAAPARQPEGQSAGENAILAPTVADAATCDAKTLAWALGQVADDVLIERARTEAGAQTVRVLRPGMMITNDFSATRLNIRIDNSRKVLSTICG